jgi:DNA ligase-1
VLLQQIVETSAAVASTRSRSEKVELLAACIAGMGRDEVAIGAGFLAGEPRQRRLAPAGRRCASCRRRPPMRC